MHAMSLVVDTGDPLSLSPSPCLPDAPAVEMAADDLRRDTLASAGDDVPPAMLTRSKAERRSLFRESGEAFGQIHPETAADFLDLVEAHHGHRDGITVALDGRVLLAAVAWVGPEEAHALSQTVAAHNMTPERFAAECAVKIAVEHRGGLFKGVLIYPNGDRVEPVGVCATPIAARQWARTHLIERRSTLPAVTVAV